MGSYRHFRPALAALLLVLLSDAGARAADPATPRAGTARVEVRKPKPRGPTPMVERGLILPSGLLDPYLSPFVDRPIGGDELRMGTSLGTLWGIVPELHVDLQIGPFYLHPTPAPGTGRVTLTGRLVKTRPVDLGASLMAVFDPTRPTDTFLSTLQPGLPVLLRPNEHLRIDTGVHVPLYLTADPHLGLRVPLAVYVQIEDRIHLGSTSALSVTDLRDPRTTASIPFGLTGGYSAGPELRFLAITPYLTFPQFYKPGSGAVDTRSFVAGVIADFIIDLH